MGTKTQNQDLETTWMIDTSNDTYILGKNAEIVTDGDYAIQITAGSNNNDVLLKGDIKASNVQRAIDVVGNNTHLTIAKTAHVDASEASTAISTLSTNFSLNNAGDIEASLTAVRVGDFATIVNTGTMTGQTAIFSDAGLDLDNSGVIDGDLYGILGGSDGAVIKNTGQLTASGNAIFLFDGGDAVIRNDGLIMGATAIHDGDGNARVTNTGVIAGDVDLGAGEDIFNTRAGKFEGTVNGGDGNDTYIIGKSSTDILEQPAFGFDTVKSTATFTLGANLEDLILQGRKDIDGTGNEGSNTIRGNAGDNTLRGMDGADYLAGGRGNDLLIGGADGDLFEFNKHAGHDVIQDFVDGEDVIFSHFADDGPSIQDLIDNHAVEKNGGVMITYGDDTLFIKGMTMQQLDDSDFFTGL